MKSHDVLLTKNIKNMASQSTLTRLADGLRLNELSYPHMRNTPRKIGSPALFKNKLSDMCFLLRTCYTTEKRKCQVLFLKKFFVKVLIV